MASPMQDFWLPLYNIDFYFQNPTLELRHSQTLIKFVPISTLQSFFLLLNAISSLNILTYNYVEVQF